MIIITIAARALSEKLIASPLDFRLISIVSSAGDRKLSIPWLRHGKSFSSNIARENEGNNSDNEHSGVELCLIVSLQWTEWRERGFRFTVVILLAPQAMADILKTRVQRSVHSLIISCH